MAYNDPLVMCYSGIEKKNYREGGRSSCSSSDLGSDVYTSESSMGLTTHLNYHRICVRIKKLLTKQSDYSHHGIHC